MRDGNDADGAHEDQSLNQKMDPESNQHDPNSWPCTSGGLHCVKFNSGDPKCIKCGISRESLIYHRGLKQR